MTQDEQARKWLLREARAAAALDHPNICTIYEVGEEDGRSFIAMQYIEGRTLAERIKQGRLVLAEAMEVTVQTAEALAEAHRQGIIHRDIKPLNLMLTARGQVKVLDFGLAKRTRGPFMESGDDDTSSLVSTPGTILGTVSYMSPEQARGKVLDARSDIFSFGTTFYEMLSGRRPFEGRSGAEILAAILTQDTPPLEDAGTPGTDHTAMPGERSGAAVSNHGGSDRRDRDCAAGNGPPADRPNAANQRRRIRHDSPCGVGGHGVILAAELSRRKARNQIPRGLAARKPLAQSCHFAD